MKNLFTLFFVLVASAGTILASDTQVDGIWYDFNTSTLTAEVTYRGSSYDSYTNEYSGVVTIPASVAYNNTTYNVTSIGDYAFCDCSSLTSVEIPNSVTRFGNYAFNSCVGLTSVTIPNSVTSIGYQTNLFYGEMAFQGCSVLTSIEVASDNPNYCSVEGVLFNKDKTKLIKCPEGKLGAYVIPEYVISIGTMAFSGCRLTSVTIPNSVTDIIGGAFYISYVAVIYATCGDLNRIKQLYNVNVVYNNIPVKYEPLPHTITVNATNGTINMPHDVCDNLELSAIPDYGYHFTQWSDGNTDNPRIIELTQDTTFTAEFVVDVNGQCGDDLQWSLADSTLTIVGTGNMWNEQPWVASREAIKQIVFPQGITGIGNGAFSGCNNIRSITIPKNVASIGSRAFDGCINLISIAWNAINCNSYNFGSQVTSFTFGNEVEVIPSSLCLGMNQLTEIVIPNGVTSLEPYTFMYCSSLTSIVIPNSVSNFGNSVLAGCTALTTIEAPAFYYNEAVQKNSYYANERPLSSKLANVTINGGELTADGFDYIRMSYRTLVSLDMTNASNTELPDVALRDCYNLQSINLPASLERIGYMAVADCKNLQSIDIPASVTEISQSAFENCRSLKNITFGGSSSQVSGRFNAPASSASQLQRIGNWAFYNCHELQNLEIPEGVTEIGDAAFYGCTYLEELSLPSSVRSIGDNTFALCAKLQKIVVNAPVPPSIQTKTFFDVKRQIPVYVPDEVVDAYKDDALWGEFDIQGISHMPQGIGNINVGVKTQKILHNGQILILRGDKTYTLQGQEVR